MLEDSIKDITEVTHYQASPCIIEFEVTHSVAAAGVLRVLCC